MNFDYETFIKMVDDNLGALIIVFAALWVLLLIISILTHDGGDHE